MLIVYAMVYVMKAIVLFQHVKIFHQFTLMFA